DDAARPSADYNVVEAEPGSVLSDLTIPSGPTATPKEAARDDSKVRKTSTRSAPARAAAARRDALPSIPAGARKAALPDTLVPQLATLVAEAPTDAGWIYEIKFDGYRLLARIDEASDDVRLFTRRGNDWSARMPGLVAAVRSLGIGSGWLDGEIVVSGAHGTPDFNALQNAFDSARTEDIQYFVFDLPYYAGHDLRNVPLIERRAVVAAALDRAPPQERVRYSQDFDSSAKELLQNACRMRLEGMIGKRADSPYVSRRSPTWIKLKCTQRQEFVIGGYTDPRGTRSGLGSLLLGVHDEQGKLTYAGNVGTGFDDKTLVQLKGQLAALSSSQTPFHKLPTGVKGHWVKPKLVAEVSFGEWTDDGRIRHSVFHGLRPDKRPGSITREQAVAPAFADRADSDEAKTVTRKIAKKKVAEKEVTSTGAAQPAPKPAPPTAGGVKISHGERVIDQSTGLTKLDLVRYYESIAQHMLPHLKSRPTSLVRGPSGIAGQLFFQKHVDTLRIPGINELDPAFLPGHPPMLEVGTAQALVQAAQLNVIEFHTWNATTKSIENPDRMLFDLDPGEGVQWQQVVEGAMLTKAFLDELKLKAFLKTSGGKGLHIVVPLTATSNWDEVKDFSEAVVVHLARTVPQRFVAKSGPANRVGRIFIDYLRNSRGATTAAAFSARARPGLGVSIPLAWEELEKLESAALWNITNTLARVEKLRVDPWAQYKSTRQTIKRAAQILAR
ncbi:MAG: DNA ligase D, partial [Burkholderiaceae bacterium]|nr:DNA ligase D [Burkholderiaceae bacterium]